MKRLLAIFCILCKQSVPVGRALHSLQAKRPCGPSAAFCIQAQSLDALFALVEQNNPSLRTYEARCQAAKAGAHAELALADPEVEFGYLWGSPTLIGKRKDVSVTQRLDFGTLFGARRREARSRDELAELEYAQARNLVFLATQQVVIDLVYTHRVLLQKQERLATAREIEQASRKQLEAGETDKLTTTRAALELATAEAEVRRAQLDCDALQRRLHALCFGNPELNAESASGETERQPNYQSKTYPSNYLHGDLTLSLRRQEADVAARQVSAAKAEGMPELTAGYMAELTRDEKFRGITVGISVPLWHNRGNVARARAEQRLAEASISEAELELAAQRSELQARTRQLGELADYLQQSLVQLSSTPLLHRALQLGDISLIDYLQDRTAYYELQDRLLETERDYQQARAELTFLSPE